MARREITEVDYRARIARVESHLEAHLDDVPTPAELARIAEFSLHHFHRIFRGITGESLEQRVRRLRLERAARKLRGSERAVLQIAIEAGYQSHEAFTRAFRDHFGVTPSAYRAETPLHRATPIVPASVELREIDAIPIAFVRRNGPWSDMSPEYGKLFGWAAQRGVDLASARTFGLCPDDPEVTPAAQLRFDCAIETNLVPGPATGVRSGRIPAGLYAIAAHRGPFDTIASTYLGLIGEWIPSKGYALADEPVVELYLDDPRVVPPAELRSEIWARLVTFE
jgi:AraC family transcriptional regulator